MSATKFPLTQEVEKLGGIRAIAISHPHFYSAMVAWGRQFNAPIYVHEVLDANNLHVACPCHLPSAHKMLQGRFFLITKTFELNLFFPSQNVLWTFNRRPSGNWYMRGWAAGTPMSSGSRLSKAHFIVECAFHNRRWVSRNGRCQQLPLIWWLQRCNLRLLVRV